MAAAIIKHIPELMADTLRVWTSETIVEQLAQIQRRLRLLKDSIGLPAASWGSWLRRLWKGETITWSDLDIIIAIQAFARIEAERVEQSFEDKTAT
eukprot:3760855-Heterocapsa_arctica.AAC.1